jgi:large conductance mechanosensitive channel
MNCPMISGAVLREAAVTRIMALASNVAEGSLGLLTGGVDFKEMALTLRAAHDGQPAVLLKYGSFIQTVFDFFLVAVAIFAMVQAIAKLKRSEPAPAPAEAPKQEVLLEQIRDAIRAQKP